MIERKSLKDLSWNVSEEEYRKDEALSYSTIASFAREGFRIIPLLGQVKDTPSLRYGSLVDTILTDQDEIDSKFFFVDMPSVSKAIENIVNRLDLSYPSLKDIPKEQVLASIEEEGYYNNLTDSTRIKKIVDYGSEYYNAIKLSENKLVLPSDTRDLAIKNVYTLKTHPFTSYVFEEDENTEVLYQLKFKTTLGEDIGLVRMMADIIKVDHKNKIIRPYDLKTTGNNEEDFESSFLKWRYDMQADLYTLILQEIISKDEYFKDFTILPFTFVVINKYNNTPIVWHTDGNRPLYWTGEIEINGKKYKSLVDSISELRWHLEEEQYSYSRNAIRERGQLQLKSLTIYE